MQFEPMAKIPRWSREVIITEKIDGTNASVLIIQDGIDLGLPPVDYRLAIAEIGSENKLVGHVFAGSRTRLVRPGKDDNYGFAAWVQTNVNELIKLGPGQHFGEWWGSGIQRKYGLTNGERRFSLFDTRWAERENRPTCVNVVPVIYRGILDTDRVEDTMKTLWINGSFAAPGFMSPEGIIVWHSASGQLYKKTFEKDQASKEAK